MGQRVLLVDSDPQGHLTLGLGFPKNIRVTLKNGWKPLQRFWRYTWRYPAGKARIQNYPSSHPSIPDSYIIGTFSLDKEIFDSKI